MIKVNWKLLNFALWIEVILSYFLPFKVTDNLQYEVGFPMSFLSIYDTKFGINPFMSMHLNPLGLFLDVLVIYLIIIICVKAYQKLKHVFIRR